MPGSAIRFAFVLVLSYRYRLLPRQRQHRALEAILESQRQLYNAALEERTGAYRRGVVLSYFDQSNSLTAWRQGDPAGRSLPVSLQRATLKRLDAAYKAFFRRMKAGEKPGFPRFKGKGWFDTFGFTDFNGITLKRGKLRFLGVPGPLRIHVHRPLPEGAPLRNCTFRRDGRCWIVCIAVEVPAAALRNVQRAVGVDLGLAHFGALSDGELIPRLTAARKAERRMRVAQRSLARKQRASNGRRNAKAAVGRLHAAIRRQRANHLHQASARLVRNYDLVAIEDLNVRALSTSGLAKAVRDASWGKFISMLRYKAERAGVRLVEVDCRGTTQVCSSCGTWVRRGLGPGGELVGLKSFVVSDRSSSGPLQNNTDLWWNPSESGWGLNVIQHGSGIIFATWFNYAPDGKPIWYVIPVGQWVDPIQYHGPIFRTTGPVVAEIFDPTAVTATMVGNAVLIFDETDFNKMTATLTVDGNTIAKQLQRQGF